MYILFYHLSCTGVVTCWRECCSEGKEEGGEGNIELLDSLEHWRTFILSSCLIKLYTYIVEPESYVISAIVFRSH